jgi:pimeloyl-ACP methyl ester carboxylesterase
VIAPLAKLLDWSAIQILARTPPRNPGSPKLEEALQFIKRPDFIPAESQPAQVEFAPHSSGLHFHFPTPQPCAFTENNVVSGRLYRCAPRWQERPVIVLLHGAGDSFGYRFRYPMIARRCNRAGFNAATLVAPYHFQRRPRQPGALSWPNYLLVAQATAQAVAEIRALTGWLLQEGCPAIALWGYSFGGWIAGLTACHDARLASLVLAAPRVRMNVSSPKIILWPRIRKLFQEERGAWETLDLTSLNLTSNHPVVPKRNILLIEQSTICS